MIIITIISFLLIIIVFSLWWSSILQDLKQNDIQKEKIFTYFNAPASKEGLIRYLWVLNEVYFYSRSQAGPSSVNIFYKDCANASMLLRKYTLIAVDI